MHSEQILKQLRSLANPKNVAGMARYGINTENTYGVPIYILRPMAREIGADHTLAQELWSSGIREARILASMIDDPRKVAEEQIERWAMDFDSWDVCDQVCSNLFDKTDLAYHKASEWSHRDEEFVKRGAFALMAALAAHDKQALDEAFEAFLPLIREQAADGRNYVRKAVNWALRNIGKRNVNLNGVAIATAKELGKTDSKSARWVAADALRDLTSGKVQKRLGSRPGRPR